MSLSQAVLSVLVVAACSFSSVSASVHSASVHSASVRSATVMPIAQQGGEVEAKTPKKAPAQEPGGARPKPDSDLEPGGVQQKGREAKGDSKPDKAIVNKMMADAKKHAVRIARIIKLQEVFADKGDEAKVAELEKMLIDEKARYGRLQDEYRRQLGPEMYGTVHGPISDMQGKRGKAHAEAKKRLKASLKKNKGKGKGKPNDADKTKGKPDDADKPKGKPDNAGKGQGKGAGKPDDAGKKKAKD